MGGTALSSKDNVVPRQLDTAMSEHGTFLSESQCYCVNIYAYTEMRHNGEVYNLRSITSQDQTEELWYKKKYIYIYKDKDKEKKHKNRISWKVFWSKRLDGEFCTAFLISE